MQRLMLSLREGRSTRNFLKEILLAAKKNKVAADNIDAGSAFGGHEGLRDLVNEPFLIRHEHTL